MQAGVADLEVLPTVCQLRRTSIETRARLAAGLCRFRLGGFPRVECRHQRLELGDAGVLSIQPVLGLADRVLQRLRLRLRVSAFGLRPGQRVGAGRKSCVMSVELPAELGLSLSRCLQLDTTHLFGAGATFELGCRNPEALLRLLESRRRGTATGGTDAPSRGSETVPVIRDHDGLGIGDRQVDGIGEGRHAHGRADDGVQQFGDAGSLAANVRPHRHTVIGQRHRQRLCRAERYHGSVNVRRVQRVERVPLAAPRPWPPAPDQFLPLAEETGLLVEFGARILRDSLAQLAHGGPPGFPFADCSISVNVGTRQLVDPNFYDIVVDALAETGIDADSLWLEITETALLSDVKSATVALRDRAASVCTSPSTTSAPATRR